MHSKLGLIFFVAGITAALSFFWPRTGVLEITRADSGKLLCCARMGMGEEFVLTFTHSVNKRPVHDTLRAEGGRIVIVGSLYDSFGAGMPEASTPEGTLTVLPGGWIQWTVNRPVPEIVVRVGRVAGHTLTLKGRKIPLADLAEPGSAVSLRVTRNSFPEILLKGGCMW